MSIKYKTKFQDHWLNEDNYKQWVKKCPKVCLKVKSVAGLGIKALEKHVNGSKQKQPMSVCDKYSIKCVVGPPAMLKMALCTQQTFIVLVALSQLENKAEIM